MTLWLYLHFPSLQLDAMYKQADAHPLIVVNDKKNEVIQLNPLALRAGIKVGMGLGTASALCQTLQVKVYEQTIENRVLKRIAHWLYSVTADIALYPPNGLLLKVSNMLTLYRGLEHYWQVLSKQLNRLSIDYHYATGYSPLAARALAKQRLNQISDDKQWLLKQVSNQPLSCSDLESKTIADLQKVGVRTFTDLLALPLPQLAKRFSRDVVNYIGRLTGHFQHPVVFYIPPERFEHYLELYYEVSNSQYLEKPLLKIFLLLEHYLRLKDKLATELVLILHQRDKDDLSLSTTAGQGEYKANKWLQLTKLNLESMTLNAPVVGLTLKTKQLINKYAQHNDLFQGSQGNLSVEELTSILTAKLGPDRIKGLRVTPDHRPEVANQLCEPFSPQLSTIKENKLRPSVLYPSPLPLRESVTVIPYPERIVTGWWDTHQIVRDYFVGRTPQGRWLWLFKDNKQHWFIHGVFS